MNTENTPKLPTCRGCLHYFITYDARLRYGCAAFGIKSARQPVRDVMEASWQHCLYFVARPDRKAPPGGGSNAR